ncbi:MAG: hypothetical protein QOF30_3043 [Acidimicrobiaceae bacterium]|jgi:hypothetical protein|nr:hypothetical protein [Acidimicrobiaceae bacterium]
MASVVFVPHQDCCQGCADYVALLATAADGLRDWATRPMVIAGARDTAGLGGAGELPGVVMLVDEAGAVRARLGVDEDQALVVQADRWGAVYAVESVKVTADHQAVLPTAENLVALAKFVDIQCPECGIPSKEWLGSSAFPLG